MATNQTGNVNSLGTAEGKILIDVSSLAQASQVIKTFVSETQASFATISTQLKDLAAITSAASKVVIAQYEAEAQAAKSAAEIQIAAIKAQAQASADATRVQIQESKERIAILKDEAAQTGATSKSGQTSAGTRPSGLARSIFSLGFAAQGLGIEGLAQPTFAIGGILQLEEEVAVFRNQIVKLASGLKEAGGVLGGVANIAASIAAPFGTTAAAFASVLAVLAPLAVVAGAFIAVVLTLTNAIHDAQVQAQEYIDRQTKINTLIAGGAGTTDLQKEQGDAQAAFDAQRAILQQLQPFYDELKNNLPVSFTAAQGAAGGNIVSKGFLGIREGLEETGVPDLERRLKEATGGQITTLDALVSAYQTAVEKMQAAGEDVIAVGSHFADLQVLLNDLAIAANKAANAAAQEAEFRQKLSTQSYDQIRQQLTNAQQTDTTIRGLIDQTSGKQREVFQQQLDGLEGLNGAAGQLKDLADAISGAVERDLADFVDKANALAYQNGLQQQRTNEDRIIADVNAIFDHLQQQARAAEDFIRQRTQEIQDYNLQSTRAQEDFDQTRAKAERNYQEQVEQAERDHQARLAKIIADARLTILQAAQQLDARAIYNEQQRRNQQLIDENNSAATAKAQREDEFRQQQDDQQEQYDLQRQRAQEDFERRLAREDQQRAIQNRREQEDWNLQRQRQEAQYQLQDARRQQDFARQIVALTQHYTLLANIQDVYQNVMELSWSSFLVNLVSQVENSIHPIGAPDQSYNPIAVGGNRVGGSSVYPNYNTGTGRAIPSFDTGGVNFSPGLFMSTVPEMHVPLTKMGALGGDFTWNGDLVLGDIGNYDEDEILRLFEKGFRQLVGKGMQRLG